MRNFLVLCYVDFLKTGATHGSMYRLIPYLGYDMPSRCFSICELINGILGAKK